MITELRYSNTNTYLIQSKSSALLFDTGWAGTFPAFCKALGEKKLRAQDISLLLISHFHPDHMGIAQEIADTGAVIAAADIQREFIHSPDSVFEKEGRTDFKPIDDSRIEFFTFSDSRAFLKSRGIDGEVLHTPGHSEDSISLWLDKEKALFVGDLNPLYELEMHKGTEIAESWERLLKLRPKMIYYGHAKASAPNKALFRRQTGTDVYALVKRITKLIDKGFSAEEIQKKTGAEPVFIADVARMYLTHPNVSVQGILDRIEIKGR